MGRQVGIRPLAILMFQPGVWAHYWAIIYKMRNFLYREIHGMPVFRSAVPPTARCGCGGRDGMGYTSATAFLPAT